MKQRMSSEFIYQVFALIVVIILAMGLSGVLLLSFLERYFLEAIEVEPIPEMIAHPRENPYVFYEEYYEEDDEDE